MKPTDFAFSNRRNTSGFRGRSFDQLKRRVQKKRRQRVRGFRSFRRLLRSIKGAHGFWPTRGVGRAALTETDDIK